MARLGKAVDLIDEASSLVRGSQVISSDLVAKARNVFFSPNRQIMSCGIFIVTYKIYIYMASNFCLQKLGEDFLRSILSFFLNRWFN